MIQAMGRTPTAHKAMNRGGGFTMDVAVPTSMVDMTHFPLLAYGGPALAKPSEKLR